MPLPTPDEVILGLLALEPQHGYQLLETFNASNELGLVWSLSHSQLYAVLKRLESAKLIHGREITQENAPPRTEYAPTQAGLGRLHTWLNEPNPSPSVRRVRVEFLSRLYVAYRLNLSITAIVEHQRAACAREVAALRAQQTPLDGAFGALPLTLIIAQLGAVLTWIDQCEHDLLKLGGQTT